MGRVAAGKTTLMQRLKGEQISYCKTQYVYYTDTIIDTPGEYTENGELAAALALYTYEADIVGLLIASDYPYNPFPPCCTSSCNREVSTHWSPSRRIETISACLNAKFWHFSRQFFI